VLERIQNQALRLITGAVKTTPIDAMTLTTGNKPIQELIKKCNAATRETAQNPRRSILENIRTQAEESKGSEWIYIEGNRNKDKIWD
jgi:hypothetical protein